MLFSVPVFCEEINIARTHMDSLYRSSGSFVFMPKLRNVIMNCYCLWVSVQTIAFEIET